MLSSFGAVLKASDENNVNLIRGGRREHHFNHIKKHHQASSMPGGIAIPLPEDAPVAVFYEGTVSIDIPCPSSVSAKLEFTGKVMTSSTDVCINMLICFH